jgi:glycosyltransferase involved in cell wall biosynthesis
MTYVLLDISRLCIRAHRAAPSGIDRVEQAYAHWALARDPAQTGFVVTLPRGLWLSVPRWVAVRLVNAVTRRWRDGWSRYSSPGLYGFLILAAVAAGLARVFGLVRAPAEQVVYVNVSHHMLHDAATLDALLRFYRARFVAMVHDLIPMTHPEYVRPGHTARHRRRFAVVSTRAGGILVNSGATRDAIRSHGGCKADLRVSPPGMTLLDRPATAMATDRPYFICIGTIEPRKNHLLLLHLWREMALTRSADRMPKLIVIGCRGWENEMIVDMLERCEAIQPHVEEHNRLHDGEMAALLAGARALLMPSFAEGFGLPVAEALTQGVPVLCSDLPAHREVGGDAPEYLDPLDASAWRAAIDRYARPDSEARQAQLARINGWRISGWADHFTVAEGLIEDVAKGGMAGHG